MSRFWGRILVLASIASLLPACGKHKHSAPQSPSGPLLLRALPGQRIEEVTALGDSVYFTVDDGAHGIEVWKSDGTAGGTHLLKDIAPGATPSRPNALVAMGAHLYFFADDGEHGTELWTSDGTPAGTKVVKESIPGPGSGTLGNLTGAGSRVFYSGYDSTNGIELWTSDGTEAGTRMVANIRSGSGGSNPRMITP